jgi:hypothetical protein
MAKPKVRSNHRPPATGFGKNGAGWSAWGHLMEQIDAAKAELDFREFEECFYRGHICSAFPLLPTLLRLDLAYKTSLSPKARLREIEQDLFFEFQARAKELHALGLSDWDYLFYMRHYGLPTRILDWTESLGVALFFALGLATGEEAKSPCLWLLNPYLLNKKEWGRDLVAPQIIGWDEEKFEYYDYGELLLEPAGVDIEWKSPVAIYPQQRNARVSAQRGWFTIHGRKRKPLEDIKPNAVRKIDIPLPAIPVIKELLDQMGLDKFTLYGDLDSLSDTLATKNKLKYLSWG